MPENVETPFTPEDFDEFSRRRDENIVLGINIGMEIEVRSRNFYQSVEKKLPTDKKILLKFLANEELDHLQTLIAFRSALQKNDSWIQLNEKQLRKIKTPKLYEGKGSVPFIEKNASDTDIILSAMRAEKRTEEFYKRIEEKVRYLKAKMFFDLLARFERKHYDLLTTVLTSTK